MKKHLQELIDSANFVELFELLDGYFNEKPDFQYSMLKQNLLHQIKQGFFPNPMQVQGLKIFLNQASGQRAIEYLQQKRQDLSERERTHEEAQRQKGINDYRLLLIEKLNFFRSQLAITANAAEKFELRKRIDDIEGELGSE
jgi:hypothetical protein